ncbi:MAG: cyclopropane-fatty-acyl-phospholipid synthase family protein [Pseudomonadota bacterium]
MNPVSDAAQSSAAFPAPRFSFPYFVRERTRAKLATLSGGELVVTDPWGEWRIGEVGMPVIRLAVRHPQFYTALALEGSLGVCRAFFEGAWRADDLAGLFRLFIRNESVADGFESGSAALGQWVGRVRDWRQRNTKAGSRRNIHAHYDLGNEFFGLFLDESMTYSCGIFTNADDTMYQASVAKLDRICQKLALSADDHVLEIGTGWGSFAIHAASNYGCKVTTTTISAAQREEALRRVEAAGLSDRITILEADYRDLEGQYDKLVSIEMIEAVGHQFLPDYFAQCAALLKPNGAMVIQAITMPDQRYDQYLKSSDFIRRYIFPGSCCPSFQAITDAVSKRTDLNLQHVEDIGLHYAETLRRWGEAFSERESDVVRLGYPRSFIRRWRLYLAYCEAGFDERYLGLLQLLYVKPGSRLRTPLGHVGQ